MSSKVTLSPENLQKMDEGIISLFEEGYNYVYCNCAFENIWSLEDSSLLYKKLKILADYLIDNNLELLKGSSILTLDLDNNQQNNEPGNFCGGTGKMLAVDYKGDYFPCLRYMGSSLGNKQPEYIIGTVKNGLADTPESKQRIDLLDSITKDSQSEQKCLECPVSVGCAWCSGFNYEEFGTPNKRATYICDMHKARVMANYYYQNSF